MIMRLLHLTLEKVKVRYTLKAGNTELAQFESNALYQMLIKLQKFGH